MIKSLLAELHKTAERIGACDPLWLKSNKEPVFTAVEPKPEATGPELVLLHGLLGALSNWNDTYPEMEKFCRPIALEFPILTAHRSEVKVKALAAYTEYFVRSRKISPVALCGNSLGGHVAMRMYFASPELVDCMILSGSSGLYEHTVDALPVRPDRNYIRDSMTRVFYDQKFVTDAAVEEIYQALTARMNVLNLIHAARSAKKDNMREILKNIKVPVLLIWGEDDLVTTMDVAETFHKEIPGSKLVVFKKCGHAPMIEHPKQFADEVEKFLKEHSRHHKA